VQGSEFVLSTKVLIAGHTYSFRVFVTQFKGPGTFAAPRPAGGGFSLVPPTDVTYAFIGGTVRVDPGAKSGVLNLKYYDAAKYPREATGTVSGTFRC
jgi:hypothetical protein